MYVVIGTSPFADTSVAVGPFRSIRATTEAEQELIYRGYVTETRELLRVSDLDNLPGAEDGD